MVWKFRRKGKERLKRSLSIVGSAFEEMKSTLKKSARFIFHDLLKDYMRQISPGEIVNDDHQCNAVEVSARGGREGGREGGGY